MGLRFPTGLLFLRATSSINSATAALVNAERIVASGKRVNTVSDDPAASTRILSLNREGLDANRFLDTITLGHSLVDGAAASLQSISDMIASARETALNGANPKSQDDRDTLASVIDGILDECLSVANQKFAGRYAFGGTIVDTPPYSIETVSGQEYTTYHGNRDTLKLLTGYNIRSSVTMSGPDVFQVSDRGETTMDGNTGAALGTGPNTGTGDYLLKVTHGATSFSGSTGIAVGSSSASGDTAVGSYSLVIDNTAKTLVFNGQPPVSYTGTETNLKLTNAAGDYIYVNTTGITSSATVTVTSSANLSTDNGATQTAVTFASSQKVVNSVTGALLNVNSTSIVRVGNEHVTNEGTFDLFTVLRNLRDDLRNEDSAGNGPKYATEEDQLHAISERSEQLSDVQAVVLRAMGVFGGRSNQLDQASDRFLQIKNNVSSLLSQVQDADLASAITDYTKAEAALQYSQAVAGRVLQISFLNFLS